MKKKNVLIIIGIFSFVLMILGVSYGYFVYNKNVANISLNTGEISINLSNVNGSTSLTNVIPKSDYEGINSTDYIDFTVNGTVDEEPIYYEVYILPKSGNTLDTSYIKTYLTDQNNNKISRVKFYNELENSEKQDGRALYNDYVVVNNDGTKRTYTKNFRLRLWLDESYHEQVSKTFDFDILIYAKNASKGALGSETNPIQINYIEDLVDLAVSVNSGTTYEGQYIRMMRDLDFNDNNSYKDATNTETYGDYNGDETVNDIKTELTEGSGCQPIGNETYKFQGTFNGDSHTLSNIYINNSKLSELGLFGRINNATIKNVKTNGNIRTSIKANTGGICGISDKNSIIVNCYSNVNITSNSTNYSLGGIIGDVNSENLIIEDCSNSGTIQGSNNAGGLVGWINRNTTLTINNSYNEGEVIQNKGDHAGGLVGRANSATSRININNSYNKGKVTLAFNNISAERYAGGLVGRVSGVVNIDSSYNEGEVLSTITSTTSYVFNGGLTGQIVANGQAYINKSHNTGKINGGTSAGGVLGAAQANTKVLIANSYNEGEVSANITSTDDSCVAGGIMSRNIGTVTYVLNSYNTGRISSLCNATNSWSSGITHSGENNSLYIINSYNAGDIVSTYGFASGVACLADEDRANTYINNVYNSGTLTSVSQSESRGIIYDNPYSNTGYTTTINNSYYLNIAPAGSNDYESYTTAMSASDMKSNKLVNQLNTNKSSINLVSISSDLADYSLSSWKLGKDKNPTFDW